MSDLFLLVEILTIYCINCVRILGFVGRARAVPFFRAWITRSRRTKRTLMNDAIFNTMFLIFRT